MLHYVVEKYFKYPSIPHIFGSTPTSDADVMLKSVPKGMFIVYEKLDGANVGISMANGKIRIQNRGGFLENKRPHPQWDYLKGYLNSHYDSLLEFFVAFPNTVVFGEWMYATHTIKYTKLPFYLAVFDYYDMEKGEFVTKQVKRDLYHSRMFKGFPGNSLTLQIHNVTDNVWFHPPPIDTTEDVPGYIISNLDTESDYGQFAEGFIFRDMKDETTVFKYVKREFKDKMSDEHWFNKPLERNKLYNE